MASSYTSNYNLCQWEPSDKVLRTEFNADNAKIDTAIKAVDSKLNSKADQSALNALAQTVSGQVDVLDLRNCRFVTGRYTGSGEYGEAHPNTLYFPYKPVFLFVASDSYDGSFCAVRGQDLVIHKVYQNATAQAPTWGDTFFTWYNVPFTGGISADKQLNDINSAYHYFAILEV